jgi:hypothetical protein
MTAYSPGCRTGFSGAGSRPARSCGRKTEWILLGGRSPPTPEPDMANEPAKVDPYKQKQNIFLLYTIFLGDAVKTGHAFGIPPAAIAAIAQEEGWDEKISDLQALRNSDKPGDLERALNRAVNYVQAHSYRSQLERVLELMRDWDEEQLRAMLVRTFTDEKGNVNETLTCRPFADLASAMEKAHTLSYLALQDTAQDRSRRKEEADDAGVLSATALHTRIAAAMAAIPVESPQSKLLTEQAKLAEDLVDLDEFAKRVVGEKKKKPSGDEPEAPLKLDVPPLP